jgi:hypothetical protein
VGGRSKKGEGGGGEWFRSSLGMYENSRTKPTKNLRRTGGEGMVKKE